MVLFAYQFLYKKNYFTINFKKNYTIWALSGLFIIYLLASIFSVDPYFSFWGSPYRGGGFVTFAFYFIFAILAFVLFKKEDWKKAWIFSIFIGILVSLVALIEYYGLFNNIFVSVGAQPGSTTGNPIFLAIYLMLLFFPALAFLIKEQNKYLKAFYIFSLLLFLYTILISGTRAVYFGIVVGILYFLLFYSKKLKIIKICVGLFTIIILSVILYANINPQLPKILQNRVIEGVINQLSIKKALGDERYKAWQTEIKEIEDRPILGWGPENLAVGFDKFYNPNVTPSPGGTELTTLFWERA